jgi:hypothetical protein
MCYAEGLGTKQDQPWPNRETNFTCHRPTSEILYKTRTYQRLRKQQRDGVNLAIRDTISASAEANRKFLGVQTLRQHDKNKEKGEGPNFIARPFS